MLALLSKQPGGPETLVLETLTEPRPKPGEILLSVRACGVNYPDALIIEDRYQFKPERPFAPGSEVSGIVESLGEGLTSLNAGDRVIGSARRAIRPVISERVPLQRAGEAIAALSARKAMGKIVVTIHDAETR